MPPRILVTTGEPSGDLHGARVVEALRERLPDTEIDAVGGPQLARVGARIIHPLDGLDAMGFVEPLLRLLPFEPPFFAEHGLQADYVGHPLVDLDPPPDRASARHALGIAADARVLALFPGSRRGEISRLWPPYRDAALKLLADGRADVVLVAGTAWGRYAGADRMLLVRERPSTVLAAAEAVLAKSGTTTLEAAIADEPMVGAYRAHPITFR